MNKRSTQEIIMYETVYDETYASRDGVHIIKRSDPYKWTYTINGIFVDSDTYINGIADTHNLSLIDLSTV